MDYEMYYDEEDVVRGPVFPVAYRDFLEDVRNCVFGQDEALEDIIYDIFTFLRSLEEDNVAKHNFILAGPTASGKTELYRTVKRLLKKYNCDIPVLLVDASNFSPTGYQGNELSEIAEQIHNAGSSGEAILFLDEFDKILFPGFGQGSYNPHIALQHEMLTLIEGREIHTKQRGLSSKVDTSKTLFIAMGAFSSLRKVEEKVIGFTPQKTSSISVVSFDDVLNLGTAVELLGRFDTMYNFKPLDEIAFEQLFEKMVIDVAIEQHILITTTDQAWKEFSRLCHSEYGCREIKRKIYETIRPCLKKVADEKERVSLKIVIDGIKKSTIVKNEKYRSNTKGE